jgi:ABC-type polysaccharide/polyol phosphate transport system ATPase subunit
MRMRLGFAIAAHIEPEILLIDEVLAVGDLAFQDKCINRIKQFKENGCTVLIVSHNLDFIRENCDTVLWLHMGRVKAYDQAEPVVSHYLRFMGKKASQQADSPPSTVLTPLASEV